jgi:WD40 repeat protein
VEQVRRIKGHSGDVYALEFGTSEERHRQGNLVSGGDYTIKTWNSDVCNILIHTGQNLLTMTGHTGYVSCIKLRGKRAFSGSWDTTVRSWNLEVSFINQDWKGNACF